MGHTTHASECVCVRVRDIERTRTALHVPVWIKFSIIFPQILMENCCLSATQETNSCKCACFCELFIFFSAKIVVRLATIIAMQVNEDGLEAKQLLHTPAYRFIY